MLEISSPVASETVVPSKRRLDNSSTPINIDYTSKVISHFLDLPNQANPAPSPFTYEDTKLLNELCDQFNVDHHFKEMVKDRLEGVLERMITIWHGKVADYDGEDFQLESWFLRTCSCPEGDDGVSFIGKMRSLPDHWQADIWRRAFSNPTFDIESRRFTSEVTEAWDRSAREFDPDHESPY